MTRLDIEQLTAPGVSEIQPYSPGKPLKALERELGITDAIKLASNESPIGPSPAVAGAIRAAFPELARYPESHGFELKQLLSDHLLVAPEQIVLGNGSNEVLELVARAFLSTESEAVYSQYAFTVYPIVTQAAGATARVVPAIQWGSDLDGMLAAINARTRVVFIANPNNPTGTYSDVVSLKRFVLSVPQHVLVVIDEAYFEYVDKQDYPNALKWLDRCPNLIVTRTFSKAYGLAGARLGYAVCNEAIANVLNRVREPFNINALALAAGEAAVRDQAHVQRAVEVNRAGMAQIETGCQEMGLDYIPSVGNFVSVHFGDKASTVYEELLHRGVIVRPVANYAMPEHLRISIGLKEENERFLSELQNIWSQHGSV